MKEPVLLRLAHIMHMKAAVAVLALFILAVMAIVVVQPRKVTSEPTAQQGSRDELHIQLNSNGFSPNEVQHAPGRFAIAVENNALSGEYLLQLKAEDGTVLNELQVQKGSAAMMVNLQAGRYTLTEANHTQWSCRMVIQ